MKKSVTFRILLPLLILLMGGYGTGLLANFDSSTNQFPVDASLTINKNHFFQANLLDALVIKQELPASKRTDIKVRVTDNEIDEDEVQASNNQLIPNKYFANFYQSLSSSDRLINFKEISNFQTVFYYLTTYKKFVLFQVFRI